MKVRAVIFDFDQTLVNDYPQHTRAFLLAAKKFGYRLSKKKIQKKFGVSAKSLVHELIPKMTEKELEKFVDYKENSYRKLTREKGIKLIPNVLQTLKFLRKKKIKIAIASSASRQNILLDFQKTGLSKFRIPFIAAEDVHHTKPNPEPLLKAARLVRVSPKNCYYIGDSKYEMIAAKRAKMFAIGIHTGAYSEKELEKNGAKIVFKNFKQLEKFLRKQLTPC